MKRLFSVSAQAAVAGSLGLLFIETDAFGSGFSLPEISAAGLGLSNALVANPREPGAFAYNPAAMGFHERSSIALGALFIAPSFSVETLSGHHDSDGSDWVAAPLFQGALKVNERWRVGVAVNAPFGLETRWKIGTFPMLSQPIPIPGTPISLPAGFDHPTQSKLEIIAAAPAVTYRLNDYLSLAAGVDYYHANSTALNTVITRLEGDGDGWGWNLGVLLVRGPWSFGATYHAAARVGIEGTVTTSNPTLLALGTPASQDAKVDLELPFRLQIGTRYAFNPRLAVELDWTRTGWSKFEALKIKAKADKSIISVSDNNWRNSNAYRIGLTYSVFPITQLRFGYSYDETGQGDDQFNARVPDSDRHLFSVGIAQDLGDGWGIEAGYMYVHFEERDFRGDKPYIPTRDINGTEAIDGDYTASAHLFGLEIRRTF